MTHRAPRLVAPVFAALVLTACGGGGGSTAAPTPAPTPAPPPPISQKGIEGVGVVSQFGSGFQSITVGSTTYDTTSATVTVDNQPAMLSDLDVGNVVRVTATTDDDGVTATASAIRQINDLEGTVDAGSIDLAAGTFGVLGQTIRVVATTLFEDDFSPASLEGLSDGDAVEVSVLAAGDGVYIATRVELDDDVGDFEITGVVSNLDGTTFQFNLGPLLVDYSGAMLEDFDGGMITDGDRVEVEGSAVGAGGELIADVVYNEDDDFDGEDGDFGDVEGFISRFVSATDFDVDGQSVTTNGDTSFEDGVATDLALGVRVEVEGEFDANGVLIAEEIDFEDGEDDADVEISALLDAVDASAGSVTVLGLTLSVAPDATLEDDSASDLEPFSLSDLSPGDFVEITVIRRVFGREVLVLVRDDFESTVSVEAPVDAVTDPQLTVLGLTVETTTDTEFEDEGDTSISAAEFFGDVMAGDFVDVEGTWDGTAITAEEVSLEKD